MLVGFCKKTQTFHLYPVKGEFLVIFMPPGYLPVLWFNSEVSFLFSPGNHIVC